MLKKMKIMYKRFKRVQYFAFVILADPPDPLHGPRTHFYALGEGVDKVSRVLFWATILMLSDVKSHVREKYYATKDTFFENHFAAQLNNSNF